jgi:hypothetical protein
MCPACAAMAATIAMLTAGVASTGALGVVLAKRFRSGIPCEGSSGADADSTSLQIEPKQNTRRDV